MKKKQHQPEAQSFEAWEQPSYQTGSTQPPKSYSGIVAFLLVMVIFLCGIATALSVMNFRLLGLLETAAPTESTPLAFSQGDELVMPDSAVEYPLGFAGQAVPTFWQDYHGMPPGIYVAEVTNADTTRTTGLQPGDILTGLDGVTLTDETVFWNILDAHTTGDILEARVCRADQLVTVQLIME